MSICNPLINEIGMKGTVSLKKPFFFFFVKCSNIFMTTADFKFYTMSLVFAVSPMFGISITVL